MHMARESQQNAPTFTGSLKLNKINNQEKMPLKTYIKRGGERDLSCM